MSKIIEEILAPKPEARPRIYAYAIENAKMRFGKTFTAYQLARMLKAKRVLVVTFKRAVEDSWQTDLESHIDFRRLAVSVRIFRKRSRG